MTDNTAQAAELVQLAHQKNCVLQVGHVERFNPVFKYLETVATEPRFIETPPAVALPCPLDRHRRRARFDDSRSGRGARVCKIARDERGRRGHSRVEQVRGHRQRAAALRQWLRRQSHRQSRQPGTDAEDSCVQRRRDNPSYISLDYRAQEGFIYRIARAGEAESSLLKKVLAAKLGVGKDSAIVSEFGGKRIVREPVPIAKDEPLKLELQSFVNCVREKQTPVVSGESAKRALDLAFEITRQIQSQKN